MARRTADTIYSGAPEIRVCAMRFASLVFVFLAFDSYIEIKQIGFDKGRAQRHVKQHGSDDGQNRVDKGGGGLPFGEDGSRFGIRACAPPVR